MLPIIIRSTERWQQVIFCDIINSQPQALKINGDDAKSSITDPQPLEFNSTDDVDDETKRKSLQDFCQMHPKIRSFI